VRDQSPETQSRDGTHPGVKGHFRKAKVAIGCHKISSFGSSTFSRKHWINIPHVFPPSSGNAKSMSRNHVTFHCSEFLKTFSKNNLQKFGAYAKNCVVRGLNGSR